MKNLLISLVILLLTSVNSKDEFISLEHIGISDKPIPTIILSIRPINKKVTKYDQIIVEDKSFKKLGRVIEINKPITKLENTMEYGCFLSFQPIQEIQLVNPIILIERNPLKSFLK